VIGDVLRNKALSVAAAPGFVVAFNLRIDISAKKNVK